MGPSQFGPLGSEKSYNPSPLFRWYHIHDFGFNFPFSFLVWIFLFQGL